MCFTNGYIESFNLKEDIHYDLFIKRIHWMI
jgi:hypothetical protein